VIEALLQAERLLLHGMVEQAERIYSSALEQDPLNSIAVVGLARVALERGDDQLAYAQARRALEIDPENAAAQRLEARLAEVLAERAAPEISNAPAPEVQSMPTASEDARPSEQVVFTRNPSMAEHQAMEDQREMPRASPREAREPAPEQQPEKRAGLFKRLFGE
jgi:tetratricopeptide (TPR) repeat protein